MHGTEFVFGVILKYVYSKMVSDAYLVYGNAMGHVTAKMALMNQRLAVSLIIFPKGPRVYTDLLFSRFLDTPIVLLSGLLCK